MLIRRSRKWTLSIQKEKQTHLKRSRHIPSSVRSLFWMLCHLPRSLPDHSVLPTPGCCLAIFLPGFLCGALSLGRSVGLVSLLRPNNETYGTSSAKISDCGEVIQGERSQGIRWGGKRCVLHGGRVIWLVRKEM